MSKISIYEVTPVPKLADKLIGTSVGGTPSDITYNFTLSELLNLFNNNTPATTLQTVLNNNNTATQDINLTGTVSSTSINVSNTATLYNTNLSNKAYILGELYDKSNSKGTSGQVLKSTGSGVEWYTIPTVIPNLQQVLASGNTSNISIVLDANLQALDINVNNATIAQNISINGTLKDQSNSLGNTGQVLTSTQVGVEWTDLPVYTATSPLSINAISRVISIPQAGSAQNGYLSSTDWINFDAKQSLGNYITELTGEATGVGPGIATVTLSTGAITSKLLTGLTVEGGGITSSDSVLAAFGKLQNQINTAVSGLSYRGSWNANTNTPALASGIGTNGYYYIVSVAGTTNLDGITDWQVGDWAIFNESLWFKVDNTDAVYSVNGLQGVVVLNTDNVSEGVTNLYFLNSRARLALSSTSPLLYDNSTGTFSIQQASITQGGYLSAADWNTFNQKQSTLSLTTLGASGVSTLISDVLNVPTYTLNGLGGVPQTRILSINGISYDLSADRSWTIDSMVYPSAGIAISTGTAWGTSLVDDSLNWNTSYDNMIVSAAVTGTSTKTLTLNQQDGGSLTANWDDIDTGLTSVGISMSSAFSVANSPLTSNGTISITGAGTSLQYIRGDGVLATFPILTGYVPYTGATANVDLGIYSLTAESLIKSGGISSEFLKADGSVDSSAYIILGSLSASNPLSYNNTTGAFSITQSGTSSDGYLSSTDWNTFNDKQSAGSYVPTSRLLSVNGTQYDLSADRSWSVGTVTSVAALTLGTAGVDLSSTLANGTTTPVITLNVPTASAANRGALSAADWTTFNDKQQAGNYITSLIGEATATGPGASSVTLNNASVTAKVLTGVNITGGTVDAADTMLTAFGKLQNQINGLIGGSIYKGTWNASTNTPSLASGVGTLGWYYIVNVAGTTSLDGISDWFIGDWAIFDGTAWQQVDNTDAVVSVNGQTGAVSLTTDNISEGATNLYYLDSRVRAALSFTAGSGAYNSTTGVITIPTNTNQLSNSANFITLSSLSGTAPITYNNGTGAIGITQSSTSSNGYLSSTDWNTFNSKAAISGTGVSNQAAIWDGSSQLRSDPTFVIDSNHKITLYQPTGATDKNNYNIGGGNINIVTGISNTGFGKNNLNSVTSGYSNVAFGSEALLSLSTGYNNVAIGLTAGKLITAATDNIFIGASSARNKITGNFNIAIGTSAYNGNSGGPNLNSGNYNVIIGSSAMITAVGSNNNVVIGHESSYNNANSENNTAVGFQSLYTNATNNGNNTAIGFKSLYLSTGERNLAIGSLAGSAITTGSKNVIIGGNSGSSIYNLSNNIIISDGDGDTRILLNTDRKILLYQYNSVDADLSTYNIGGGNVKNVTGTNNTGFGKDNLNSVTTGDRNIAFGGKSLENNITGIDNVAVGYFSLNNNTSSSNVAVGSGSMQWSTTGSSNVAVGNGSMSGVLGFTTGSSNVAVGNNSMLLITSGSTNVCIGHYSSYNITTGSSNTTIGSLSGSRITTGSNNLVLNNDGCTTGSNNILIGGGGSITSGSSNVVIGRDSGSSIYNLSNRIIISDGNGNIRQTFDNSGAATFNGALSGTSATFSGLMRSNTLDIIGLATFNNLQIDGTNRAIQVWDGASAYQTRLSFTAAGAATFSSTVTLVNDLTINASLTPLIFLNTTSTGKASGIITQESGTSRWAFGSSFGSGDGTFNIYNYGAAARYLTIATTGAATFSAGVGINGATSTNGVLEVLKASSSIAQFSLGWNTSNHTDMYVDATGNFYIQPQGTTRLTIASTGEATFSSSVTATQFQLSAASGQYYYFDNASGNNFLGLTATNTLGLYVGGNLSLSVASTGAATFSSTNAKINTGNWHETISDLTSMAAGVGGGLSFTGYKTGTSAQGLYSAIDGYKENGTSGNELGGFRVWTSNGTNLVKQLDIASTGAATFSGSLKAEGIINYEEVSEKVFTGVEFTNSQSDKAVDIIIGNIGIWGYVKVEITSSYNYQNSAGKLTKLFSLGTIAGGSIYLNESRVSDAMGTIVDNIAIGNFYWDTTTSTYRIPISHIVSTANTFTIKVNIFSVNSAARSVFDAMTISSVYSLTALPRAYVYYNSNVGIGTTSPTYMLDVNGTARLGKTLCYNNTPAYALSVMGGSGMGDNNIAFFVEKYSATNTTSQYFVGFTINDKQVASGAITGNGAGQVTFTTWSDIRLKENIVDLPNQLSNILALRPVEFDYIASEGGGHQISFIAQEFETIYPDAVGEREDGMKTLTGWSKTEARLVKAIQEQQTIIEDLKARIETLEG